MTAFQDCMDEVKERAVIKVGDARGFIVEGERERLVLTAAHCLPKFPPCMSVSHLEERTYKKLLGPLGGDASVWAECLFVDPIGDIAVLGRPDSQALHHEAEAYEEMTDAGLSLPMAPETPEESDVWLLSLDGKWFQDEATHSGGPLWLRDAWVSEGMSGSPILNHDGAAIGVVVTTEGPHPRLGFNLPAWLAP